MQVSAIRPGLLVALSSTVKGNVTYKKTTVEEAHVEEDGALVEMWETEKVVANADEQKLATQTRSKCRNLILAHCSQTTFGYLCPESKANALQDAIVAAQEKAREFNATATTTRVNVSVLIGRVAQDDVQAVRAINGEVAMLIERMEEGVRALDPDSIRRAANQLRKVGSMLSEGSSERSKAAIKQARDAASKIVKAAEEGKAEIDQAVLTKLRQDRMAFLDLEESGELFLPSTEGTERAIDLEPEAPASASADETAPDAASEGEAIMSAAIAPSVPDLDLDEPEPAGPISMWMVEYGELWAIVDSAGTPTQEAARKALIEASGEDIAEGAEIKITSATPIKATTGAEVIAGIATRARRARQLETLDID